MKEMLKNKGITLIALIITIIVLLILAGITINLTIGQNGIMNMAELAGKNYIDAEQKEKEILASYDNEIDDYLEGARNTQNLNMHSPIKLTTIEIPYKQKEERTAGTYIGSSSEYTKTNTENMDKYLSYEEGKGWTVLKEGFYIINTYFHLNYTSYYADIRGMLHINDESLNLYVGFVNSTSPILKDVDAVTVYLNENDVIDFEYILTNPANYVAANFNIYAMFE